MKGSVTESLAHWVRICCSNWLFIHNPDELKKYDVKQYRDYRIKMSMLVMEHQIFKEFEQTLPEDLFTNKEYNRTMVDEKHSQTDVYFDSTTTVVYKILDTIEMNEQIKKEFE